MCPFGGWISYLNACHMQTVQHASLNLWHKGVFLIHTCMSCRSGWELCRSYKRSLKRHQLMQVRELKASGKDNDDAEVKVEVGELLLRKGKLAAMKEGRWIPEA